MQNVCEHTIKGQLRSAGLRPTRQRVALALMIFGQGNRHISAEELHLEASGGKIPISLATVYNTLHQLTEAGLLRVIAAEGARTWFDTNTSDHHHFYIEEKNEIIDIEPAAERQPYISNLPEPPAGMEIANVDLIIRVKPKRG